MKLAVCKQIDIRFLEDEVPAKISHGETGAKEKQKEGHAVDSSTGGGIEKSKEIPLQGIHGGPKAVGTRVPRGASKRGRGGGRQKGRGGERLQKEDRI